MLMGRLIPQVLQSVEEVRALALKFMRLVNKHHRWSDKPLDNLAF